MKVDAGFPRGCLNIFEIVARIFRATCVRLSGVWNSTWARKRHRLELFKNGRFQWKSWPRYSPLNVRAIHVMPLFKQMHSNADSRTPKRSTTNIKKQTQFYLKLSMNFNQTCIYQIQQIQTFRNLLEEREAPCDRWRSHQLVRAIEDVNKLQFLINLSWLNSHALWNWKKIV